MWANRTLLQEKWPQFDGQVGTSKLSAGLLMYRLVDGSVQLLLVHPGGPYLRGHDLGTWTIPAGEIKPDEAVLNAACSRFTEEVGLPAFGPFIPLGPAHQRSGSIVHGWAFAASDAAELQVGAEERAEWFTPQAAKFRIDPAQAFWIDELIAQLRLQS
jgi:predicted NUDIX family NTP pyrophosphohydrolase